MQKQIKNNIALLKYVLPSILAFFSRFLNNIVWTMPFEMQNKYITQNLFVLHEL